MLLAGKTFCWQASATAQPAAQPAAAPAYCKLTIARSKLRCTRRRDPELLLAHAHSRSRFKDVGVQFLPLNPIQSHLHMGLRFVRFQKGNRPAPVHAIALSTSHIQPRTDTYVLLPSCCTPPTLRSFLHPVIHSFIRL